MIYSKAPEECENWHSLHFMEALMYRLWQQYSEQAMLDAARKYLFKTFITILGIKVRTYLVTFWNDLKAKVNLLYTYRSMYIGGVKLRTAMIGPVSCHRLISILLPAARRY